MKLHAKVIVDNIGNEQAKGEWGLCIYITYGEKKILLDVGASGLFSKNAEILGVAVEEIDAAVLSHAHYDHADGMKEFFEKNKKARFYVRDTCEENCYFKKWFVHKYIGIPKGILEEYPKRFQKVSGNYEVMEGVHLIPHTTSGLQKIGKRENMYRKENGRWRPDDFSHEQSLVFETDEGLVIFNSCCHGGADTIIHEVGNAFPDKKIIALIGGFHLYNKSETFVRTLAQSIKETGIQQIYTGHCTGQKAFDILEEELGDGAHQLKIGLEMNF